VRQGQLNGKKILENKKKNNDSRGIFNKENKGQVSKILQYFDGWLTK